MIYVIGGKKTGYNLYRFIKTSGLLDVQLLYFPKEYAHKRSVGQAFDSTWNGMAAIERDDLAILTSETAFDRMPENDRAHFGPHYFLREQTNLPAIAAGIHVAGIEEVERAAIKFPILAKPKNPMASRVPFKYKVINGQKAYEAMGELHKYCILQPYLSEKEYSQIAVAGYFDGHETSLIAVEQQNHYPKGISAYVVDRTNDYKPIIKNVSLYLNNLDYRGFIEIEFKKNRTTEIIYLMDVNPRPWGWIHFYLEGIKNFDSVLNQGASVELMRKKTWVNIPRLLMAFVNGNFKAPSLSDFIKCKICYEPYLQK